jgi:hypothetical protein
MGAYSRKMVVSYGRMSASGGKMSVCGLHRASYVCFIVWIHVVCLCEAQVWELQTGYRITEDGVYLGFMRSTGQCLLACSRYRYHVFVCVCVYGCVCVCVHVCTFVCRCMY